ncbi:hypothetical protein QBC42DRAFT_278642 [Cladorrhinum samala]|uniref:Uncharacterized protein n=1 Tax=Cladorrhinum samala TaxID=585594 RepID=A0AAV9HEW7_9PEZI|nr:hypothetical protein QBC42DRAFT_278642 [Cladorrhinum samala]
MMESFPLPFHPSASVFFFFFFFFFDKSEAHNGNHFESSYLPTTFLIYAYLFPDRR